MVNFRLRLNLGVSLWVLGATALPHSASAFSLGVRPYVGSEMITIPGTTLVDPNDPNTKLTEDKTVQRAFIFYGGELAVTPVQMGPLSVTALVGYRMMKSESPQSLVSDTISWSYIPIGASVDFAVSKLRLAGYFTYDLGLSPKFVLKVNQPDNSLDLKMAKLSRLRFGGFGEFFVIKSLSVFGMGDYVTGSYETQSGPLTLTDGGTERAVQVVGTQSKFSGLTFGGGVAYYIPPPKSAQDSKPPAKPVGKPNQKKPTGKPPVKKAKPATGSGNP